MKNTMNECLDRAIEELLEWGGDGELERYREFVSAWLRSKLHKLLFESDAAYGEWRSELLSQKADEQAEVLLGTVTSDDWDRLVASAQGEPLRA